MTLRQLLQFCPDCGGDMFDDEDLGEHVCVDCGLVLNNLILVNDRTPFTGEREPQENPSNQLALGRNLGAEMTPHDLWMILQTRTAKDLPFRFNMMRNMALAETNNACLTRMLILASHLCKVYGLGENVSFSNYLGAMIRKASKYVRKKSFCCSITRAVFILAWSQSYRSKEKTEQMILDLGVTSSVLKEVSEQIEKTMLGTQSRILGTHLTVM